MLKSLFGSYASRFLAIGLVALLFQGAAAHTYLSSVVIGGTALAEGDCVRPHPPTAYDSPITLVSSANMTCGFLPQSAEPANRACPITAGSTMGVQWHHQSDAATDDILDPSHKGPILFYLANSDTGAGDVWFKIWEDGYDPTTQLWATDRMIANKGLNTFTIPADIAPGNYLLRGEVLALHQAYELNGVQPYVGCVELTISGSGTNAPAGVAFPGAYLDTDPGILINIYTTFPIPYPFPGPSLIEGSSSEAESSGLNSGSASGSSTPSDPTSAPTSTPASSGSSEPTYAPTTPATTPTNPPASSSGSASSSSGSSGSAPTGGSLTVEMNEGSSTWWLGVKVSGGSETTSNVEIKDSGSVSSWTALQDLSYAWVFSQSIQLTLPISVRLTSSSGAQVTLNDVFTSWGQTDAVNAGDYGSSSSAVTSNPTPTAAAKEATSAPTSAPSSPSSGSAPTSAPTSAPSSPSSGSPVALTVYPSASEWWFAVTVNTAASVASVEVKDSGAYPNYILMNYADWGYSLSSQGSAFTAPLTVRVTNEAGQSVTATVSAITPQSVIDASGNL